MRSKTLEISDLYVYLRPVDSKLLPPGGLPRGKAQAYNQSLLRVLYASLLLGQSFSRTLPALAFSGCAGRGLEATGQSDGWFAEAAELAGQESSSFECSASAK